MKYPADMHVHSTFSIDSSCLCEKHVQDAIGKGFRYVCFTEHYDLNPHDDGVGFYDYPAIHHETERLKALYGPQITILRGVEFSEPHLYPREFEALTKLDYDYILASIHFIDDFFILDREKIRTIPTEALFERYYHETLQAVQLGGFDAIAHFDYIRRRTDSDLFESDVLKAIFSAMAKQNIALEINTQHERRGMAHAFPTPEKAQLYAAAGGSRIVFGSDGHHPGDLGSGIENAYETYASILGLTAGVYIKRHFKALA